MFARATSTILALILFFATFVAASPMLAAATDGQCSTGPIQCCGQTQTFQQANAGGILTAILNLINVAADVNALVGLDCSPITVIGVGQSQCSASPVCCQDNNVGGVLSVGCLPIKI